MAAATSLADTSRPIGCRASSAARSPTGSGAASRSRCTQGVSVVPGLTQLTRIRSARWSAAMARVNAWTAPFVALYVLLLALIGPILAARSGGLAILIPARLFGGWENVGHETIVEDCPHVDVLPAAPLSDGCEDCRALGDTWTHLRTCLECGHVGCCDDSKNKHATAHHHETGHPAIASLEPNESWRYCYVDEVLITDVGAEDRYVGSPPA